jgi:hypothetical protein
MAKGMLESMIGSPEDDEETSGVTEDKALGDPKAAKKRALRAFVAALGVKGANIDAAAEAFADAVDACLEYNEPEE